MSFKYPYQNPNLSIEERLDDLIPRMTIEEKLAQTDQYSIEEFVIRNNENHTVEVNYEGLKEIAGDHSLGSIQARYVGPDITNLLQKYAVEETRLGIPFLMSEEALHCYTSPEATQFPQQIGMAATFDPSWGYKMGRAIATEARSYGITETFSPVMD